MALITLQHRRKIGRYSKNDFDVDYWMDIKELVMADVCNAKYTTRIKYNRKTTSEHMQVAKQIEWDIFGLWSEGKKDTIIGPITTYNFRYDHFVRYVQSDIDLISKTFKNSPKFINEINKIPVKWWNEKY